MLETKHAQRWGPLGMQLPHLLVVKVKANRLDKALSPLVTPIT
jgi:hypothetical protein